MNFLPFFSIIATVTLAAVLTAPVSAQMYHRCQPSTDCVIGDYVFDNTGAPVTASACTLDIRDPDGTLITDDAAMTAATDGWHAYTANIDSPEGFYRALMTCTYAGDTGYTDKSFYLGTTFENIDDSVWSSANRSLTSFGTLTADVWGYSGRTLSSFGTLVTDIWGSLISSMTASGSIGKLLADNLDSAVSGSGASATEIWNYLTSSLTADNSIGKLIKDNLDTNVSSRSTLSSADVWNRQITDITSTGTIGKLLADKIDSLTTLSSVNHQLLEKVANSPQIKVWYEKGSIILKAEITNPSTSLTQSVEFRQNLPREVKPEHLVQLDGLEVKYDTAEEGYYLYGTYRLTPQETIVKEVEIKNIWEIAASDLENLKTSSSQGVDFLKNSSYFAQGSILANDIAARLDSIREKQEKAVTPEEYITVYRENVADLEIARKNFDTLNSLVLAWEGEKGVVANIGGIQITAAWGIILALIAGLGVLGLANLYWLTLRSKNESALQNRLIRSLPVIWQKAKRVVGFSVLTIVVSCLVSLISLTTLRLLS